MQELQAQDLIVRAKFNVEVRKV